MKKLWDLLMGKKKADFKPTHSSANVKPLGLNAAKKAQIGDVEPVEFTAPMVGNHASRVHTHTHGGSTHTHGRKSMPTVTNNDPAKPSSPTEQ